MTSAKGLVLLAEDDERERKALGRALRGAGYGVEEVADCTQAMAALSRATFQVLLTDINMPGLSGMDLLAHVREKHADVAVVLMTGLPTVDTAVEALRDGAIDYITKPIQPESLFERLEAALVKQRVRSALEHATEQAAAFSRSVRDLNLAMEEATLAMEESTSVARQQAGEGRAASPVEARDVAEGTLAALSPREREIARLIGRGKSAGEVAQRLNLSPNTVRNHIKSIFGKLRLPDAPDDHRRVLAAITFLNSK